MLKRYFYIVFVLTTACDVNSYKSEGLPTDIVEKRIYARTLDIGNYYLNRPLSMELSDSLIILLDYFDRDFSMQAFSRKGQLISEFGKKGKGRGELMYPNSFSYDELKKTITVFDPNLKKLTSYNNLPKAKNEEIRLSSKSMSIPIKECFRVGQYTLCTGYFENERFAILDSSMNVVGYISDYQDVKHYDKKGDIPYVYNYQSKYALKPDGERIVYGSYLGVILEIYNLSNLPQRIDLIHRKEYIYPKYEKKNGKNFQVWEADNCEIGFYDFYVTNQYIYALISGTFEDVAPNSVYVFDWNGKPIMKLMTDKNLCAIAIDEKRKELYGVNISMKSTDLVVFSLEDVL